MPPISFATEPDGLAVKTLTKNGVTVVVCRGELDIATIPKLDAILAAAPEIPLVVDLCACDFIDSSGLFVLIKHHRVRPDGFGIACTPNAAPDQLFDLTGTRQNGDSHSSRLRVFPTRDVAISSFAGKRLRAG